MKRVLVFTSQSCSTLFTICSAIGWASWRYSLNCSSEHSTGTPCANAFSGASGQNDFTKERAWLTHATCASVRNLTTFFGAPRSHSSKGRSPASPSSCRSMMSTSFLVAPLRSSSSFCRCSFSSPSVLICCRQSANFCSVLVITFYSFSTSCVQ
jgi:hypothetical protein